MNLLEPDFGSGLGPVCRTIAIPAREHGYGGIETQIIESKEEFESVFSSNTNAWNRKNQVLNAFNQSNINYNKESVAIFCSVQSSGSNRVTFDNPIFNSLKNTLQCNINVNEPPGGIGTCDMAYYCFAVAFDKNKVKKVTLNGTRVNHLFPSNSSNNSNKSKNIPNIIEEKKDNSNDNMNNDHIGNVVNDNNYSFVRDVLAGLDLLTYLTVFRNHEITDERLKLLESSDLDMLFCGNNYNGNKKRPIGDMMIFRHWLRDYKNDINKEQNKSHMKSQIKTIEDLDLEQRELAWYNWEYGDYHIRRDLRELLVTLPRVLWQGSGWKPVPSIESLNNRQQCSKYYKQAMRLVHPDKSRNRSDNAQRMAICDKIFQALVDAWKKYDSST